MPSAPPETGQLARVRTRLYLTRDTVPHETDDGSVITRVDLECLDDNRLGDTLSVLWEREVNARVIEGDAFPELSGKWDHPKVYDAFLTAIRWSSTSVLRGSHLQAPFRGAIEIEPYQLEPAVRAVSMPRVNLLIADDVGLGKTIEAGLVLQEMLSRARVRNCLIVCPASLQRQWRDEMDEKFNLEFRIIDRDAVLQLRREYGTHVNPWLSFPRLITSMDYLKKESIFAQFEAGLRQDDNGKGGLASWDMLILDEAHNCAPAGRRNYVRDSDRTRMLRRIAPHFQHRLFLTATPHNGFTESFTALLAELDPLRFQRGPEVNQVEVKQVMIRRLKEQLADADEAHRPFPKRRVRALEVPADDADPERVEAEERAADLLDSYIRSRMDRAQEAGQALPVRFALTILRKRFLSSPLAFHRSLQTHLDKVTRPAETAEEAEVTQLRDEGLVDRLIQRTQEDSDDDVAKDAIEQEALSESSRFFGVLTAEEDAWLQELWTWAEGRAREPDAKLAVLRRWIREHLRTDGDWNQERLIIFTEYKDTLEYLTEQIAGWMGEERVETLMGGARMTDREQIKAAFQTHPEESAVRVLVATDAAAEGLNLQRHCRYLIHYEIPWNPNRLEQRNGRIDRHGQPAPEVFVHHFVHRNRADSRFLRTVVEKVERQRSDLGSVAAVIEESVERYMLGDSSVDLDRVSPRRTLQDDVRRELWNNQWLRKLRTRIDDSRAEWAIYPGTLRAVLDSALRLEGHRGLESAEGDLEEHGAVLKRPPAAWGDRVAASLFNRKGHRLTLVFDPEVARGRNDVVLVHLDHPLMHRALASFRRNMFSLGVSESQRLARATYRAVPDGIVPAPLLVAHARLLAVGALGQKLHEEIRSLAWRVGPDGLVPADADVIDALPEDPWYPKIPPELGARLQHLVQRNLDLLRAGLRELAEAERRGIERDLGRRAEDEADQVRQMIEARRGEIRGRLTQIRKRVRNLEDKDQLRLALGEGTGDDELQQFRQDVRLLERRRDQLGDELKTQPEQIHERYRLRDFTAFPLGLEFILPASVVDSGKLP